MRERDQSAVLRAQVATQGEAVKRAQASEVAATNLAQTACAKQAVVSLQGGRTIERIIQARVSPSGRGMVTSSDLRSIIGGP
jgi:hypothetical protein